MNPTDLCKIMGEYGSDKGNIDITNCWHNYTQYYFNLFEKIRYSPIRIFEVGLGTNNTSLPSNMGKDGKPGASMFGWAKFFPNAAVFGADIDKDILFETDRIKTFYCDQTKSDIINQMWNQPILSEPFDIIIDDGLHEFHANVCLFENSIHKLKKGGYYIIEDITNPLITTWEYTLDKWRTVYPKYTFHLEKLFNKANNWDNNLIVVHYLDQE